MLQLPPSSLANELFLEWPHPCFPNKPSLKRIGFSTKTYLPQLLQVTLWVLDFFTQHLNSGISQGIFSDVQSGQRMVGAQNHGEILTTRRCEAAADQPSMQRGQGQCHLSVYSAPCARRLYLLLLPSAKICTSAPHSSHPHSVK